MSRCIRKSSDAKVPGATHILADFLVSARTGMLLQPASGIDSVKLAFGTTRLSITSLQGGCFP